MPDSKWKTTAIFKELEAKNSIYAKKMINLLENPIVMDATELILDKGSTTPKDFTLHDADHSFRVAEKMWELIPEKTKEGLSEYELGLLLLSAYLHDIGMSPDFYKVERHKEYLTTENKTVLNEQEVNEFQKWIDNNGNLKSIDIKKEKIEDVKLSDDILTYYVRHKHNDWSGEWIKDNLEEISLQDYYRWTEDLIIICKSHHYGIDHLIKEVFDPKPIGDKAQVHLRYLSMCLRVADVMENDPERTPEVILKHRDINSNSLKYWLKDKQFTLRRKGDEFTLFARPEKAYIHKAIEETADWIENELKLCNELIKIKPLQHSSFDDLKQYEWNIEPFIHRDIRPKEGTYEYIQGAFRPNTAKLLELLGGNQLYGESIWAYREMIQNAFDAVKERIAYQIIHDNRGPSELLIKFGELYSIDIMLEKRDDGFWLVCKDQGVGMTKSVIEKYFLESGSSKRHEIRELERKCEEKGFTLSRTGQFGIGVLSYFMIADKIIITTKRELNTGYHDSESIAWKFEINGTHDFGELIKYQYVINGSQLEVKLKREFEQNISVWDERFRYFLKNQIVKTPCKLTYSSSINNNKLEISVGWTNDMEDIKGKVINNLKKDINHEANNSSNRLISFSNEEEYLKNKLHYEKVAIELGKSIAFLTEEGQIDNFGSYRISIPYFNLKKGASFYYLHEDLSEDQHLILPVDNGHFWRPNFRYINFSLKGINIKPTNEESTYELDKAPSSFVELNIESVDPSCISISRHDVLLAEKFLLVKDILTSKIKCLLDKQKDAFDNCYGTLNYRYTNQFPKNQYWTFVKRFRQRYKNDVLNWEKVLYPIINNHSELIGYTYNNQKLNIMMSIGHYYSALTLEFSFEDYFLFEFETCIYNIRKRLEVEAIITKPHTPLASVYKYEFNYIKLPQAWDDILLFGSMLLNLNHKYTALYDRDTYIQIANKLKSITKEDLLDNNKCYIYIIAFIKYANFDEDWSTICERRSDTIQFAFNKLQIDTIYTIDYRLTLTKYTFGKEELITNKDEKNKIIPMPNNEKYYLKKNK